MDASSLYAELDRRAAQISPQVIAWRHHVHQHPELSNREVNTARLIADHLKSLGLDDVRTGIAGHGVVGVLRGGQPGERVVALRGDIDALPVKEQSGLPFASTVVDKDYPGGPFPVAHACGHDCHVAMLMGTASILTALRERLAGTVLFVFQPAEEGPPIAEKGGAREMLAQGALSDPAPSMVFGMHVAPLPKGVIGYCRGNEFAASCLVKIVVNGKQTHGSIPWEGVDPMPAAAAIIGGIGQVYRQLPAHNPVTVTIGHLEDVGRFNIIGEHVTLWGTIRCSVQADMGTRSATCASSSKAAPRPTAARRRWNTCRTCRRSSTATSGWTPACQYSNAWPAPAASWSCRRSSVTTTSRNSSTASAGSTSSSACRT
ncbi:MAG TPA: amidohydrolase [Nevskiaceae bacterium]